MKFSGGEVRKIWDEEGNFDGGVFIEEGRGVEREVGDEKGIEGREEVERSFDEIDLRFTSEEGGEVKRVRAGPLREGRERRERGFGFD